MKLSNTKFAAFLCVIIIAGCKNRDKVRNDLDYNRLYFDYAVTAEEGAGYAACVLQYKETGPEGKAVNIEPGIVELDGEKLETDSAKLSGFYYEVQKPIDSFAGQHSVVFTDPNDKEYKNQFQFSPFHLAEELPEKIRRKPFSIQLNNFPATEKAVRLLLLDTAFESSGFNDMVPVVDGKLSIGEPILKNLKKGPISLALYMEQEISLQEKTMAGGRVLVSYGLQRQFQLTD